MAGEPSSFQDLLAGFSEEVFVGRRAELKLFEGALSASPRPFLILNVWGQGGVGKSTLVQRFQMCAADRGAAAAIADHEQTDVPGTLARVVAKLAEDGLELTEFKKRHGKYVELRDRIASDREAPPGLLNFLVRGAARAVLRSASAVPFGAEARDVLLGPGGDAAAAQYASEALAYLARKFKKDEEVLLREPDRTLTEAFVEGLRRIGSGLTIVLIFDTYERTAAYLDAWLRQLLTGGFGEFGSNVLFVVSGRNRLGPEWVRFRGAVRELQVDVFDEVEARRYLGLRGITDETDVAGLLESSRRLPVLLAFLTSADRTAAEATGDAVERFLQGAENEQREAALTASVPRVFDEDVLTALLGERAPNAFGWLSRTAFVRVGMKGWSYHDVVRSLLLAQLRLRSPVQCAELHERLAAFYAARCVRLGLREEEQQSNDTWRAFEDERVYHALSAAPRPVLAAALSAALQSAQSGAQWAPEPLRRQADILAQVGRETGDSPVAQCAADLHELAAAVAAENLDDAAGALAAATRLCEFGELDQTARACAFVLRGAIHRRASNIDEALADYSTAIDLEPSRADTYTARAGLHVRTRDSSAFFADLETAARLDPKALRFSMLAQFLHMARRYEAAAEQYSRAIELDPADADSWASRGRIRAALNLKGAESAESDLTRALKLDPGSADHRYWRGRVRLMHENQAGALEDFDRAVELDPSRADAHAWRAMCLYQLGERERARSAADASLGLGGEPDERRVALLVRSAVLDESGDRHAALADLTTAVELAPTDAVVHVRRAQVLGALGEYHDALAAAERTIELAGDLPDAHAARAAALLGLSQVEAARSASERAHTADPARADITYNLACWWAMAGDVEQASAWLRKAVDREPGYVDAARTDPHFDAARGTPAFEAIVPATAT